MDDIFACQTPSTFHYKCRQLIVKVSNFCYQVRCFFKPYNVVRIQNLPKTWTDRDQVLLHAMFQIFVDFIELEQPLIPWDKRPYVKGRATNQAEMLQFIEDAYGPNRKNAMAEDEFSREYAERIYPIYSEFLWIYKWYKDREWDLDHKLSASGQDYSLEIEQDHRKKCDDMLHRIVAWRHYYWT